MPSACGSGGAVLLEGVHCGKQSASLNCSRPPLTNTANRPWPFPAQVATLRCFKLSLLDRWKLLNFYCACVRIDRESMSMRMDRCTKSANFSSSFFYPVGRYINVLHFILPVCSWVAIRMCSPLFYRCVHAYIKCANFCFTCVCMGRSIKCSPIFYLCVRGSLYQVC